MLRVWWFTWVGLALVGCGSDAAGPGAGQAGGAGGSGGSAAGNGGSAGSAGAGSGSGGTSGSAGSAVAGTTSGGPACNGAALTQLTTVFTAPVPAGTASPVTAELSSPTLSADELEIFYTIGMPASPQAAWSIQRSTRAARGDVFSAGAAVPELDAACPGSNRKDIALSSDGLGVYVLCEAPDADNLLTGPLRHATRASTGGSWTVDATSYGTVGWSPTLSGDQLTLVTDSTITAPGAPTLFTRTSVSAPFGSGSLLTGLPALSSLDLAADGSFVFGKQGRMLVLAKRAAASDSFSVVNADLLMQSPLPTALGAPAHSADCSALYYIQVDAAPSGGNVWTIRAATP